MDKDLIKDIAEDAVNLRDELVRKGFDNAAATDMVTIAMPALITYEAGLIRVTAAS